MNKFIFAILLLIITGCLSLKKANTKKADIPKYCFQIMSMEYYLSHYGPTRIFINSGVWYDEYCNGICRQDSLVISYNIKGKQYFDTVVTPTVNNANYKHDNNKSISSWRLENKKLLDSFPVILNDTLIFKGLKNDTPYYVPMRK